MRYLFMFAAVLVTLCVARVVDRERETREGRNSLKITTRYKAPHSQHPHRKHHKRDQFAQVQCGHGKGCPADTMLFYYKCCRNNSDQCCWYFRLWVIAVFGAVMIKVLLACFVSFFRCVCC